MSCGKTSEQTLERGLYLCSSQECPDARNGDLQSCRNVRIPKAHPKGHQLFYSHSSTTVYSSFLRVCDVEGLKNYHSSVMHWLAQAGLGEETVLVIDLICCRLDCFL